jgi:hypothetical protein
VEAVIKHLTMPKEKADRVQIIDPCCGEGLAIKQIAEGLAIPMSNVYAVELDAGRAEKAKENLPGANIVGPASFLGTTITGFFGLAYVNPLFSVEEGGGRREEQTFVEKATRLSLSERIEDAQRTWSKITLSWTVQVVEPEPVILPWPSLDALSLPTDMPLETLADCELPEDDELGVIPIMPRDELAAMLMRLEEAGLSLEM